MFLKYKKHWKLEVFIPNLQVLHIKEMKKILSEIQNGEFAREFILENQANRPVFNALLKKDSEHMIEEVGDRLRKMMPFVGKKLK